MTQAIVLQTETQQNSDNKLPKKAKALGPVYTLYYYFFQDYHKWTNMNTGVNGV